VRAANSGISRSMDAHGRLPGRLPENREAAGVLPLLTLAAATGYGAPRDEGAPAGG
jgi:hypothetical protein